MTEIKELQILSLAEPAQVRLIRYANGYGWEINLHGENLAQIAEKIGDTDALFRERYGAEQKVFGTD